MLVFYTVVYSMSKYLLPLNLRNVHRNGHMSCFTHVLEILIMHANTHPHVQTHTSERPASSPTPVGIWQVLYIWVVPLP